MEANSLTKTGYGIHPEWGHRVIQGLAFARVSDRPSNMPLGRARGTKRMGLTYERAFGKAITNRFPRSTLLGQWFNFVDSNGHGYCQTDILVRLATECIIFECKLTDTERGRSQLSLLYFPVVTRTFGLPVRGIVVTRHLSRETELRRVTMELDAALRCPRDVIPTLHWRERNPL